MTLRPLSRCIYCGDPAWGRACPAHRDLLRLDPHQWFRHGIGDRLEGARLVGERIAKNGAR